MTTNTSTGHPASVNVVMLRNVEKDNTLITTNVNVFARKLQHATIHTSTIHIHVIASASHMTVIQVSTLTKKAVAASVRRI